ncbi:DUF92 domain-containing protein [Flavitalea sp.]|nr:DUF92 domain-containing protein [Flavitalea sp.]
MTGNLVFILLLTVMVGLTIYKHKLTVVGAITGALVAIAIFAGTGFPGIILLATFFIAATFATSWQFDFKVQLGLSEKNHGRRDSFQVLANGGIAGLLGLAAITFSEYRHVLTIMIACSLSAATADTISSELGSLYGKKFLNIMTFRPDKRGENGVVSLEGFAFGILGSSLIALAYGLTEEFSWSTILIIVIAGTVGNLVDSVLGATLERNGKIKNNGVNFLNTFSASIFALISLLL